MSAPSRRAPSTRKVLAWLAGGLTVLAVLTALGFVALVRAPEDLVLSLTLEAPQRPGAAVHLGDERVATLPVRLEHELLAEHLEPVELPVWPPADSTTRARFGSGEGFLGEAVVPMPDGSFHWYFRRGEGEEATTEVLRYRVVAPDGEVLESRSQHSRSSTSLTTHRIEAVRRFGG